MELLNRMLLYLRETQWKYRLRRSVVRFSIDSTVEVSPSAKISNCVITVSGKSRLMIGDNVRIDNAVISVENGALLIESMSIVGSGDKQTLIDIYKGSSVSIGHHSKLFLKRIWCRFGGKVEIGNYTNINYDSELRCDESIRIGSYCQISYSVNIWDTNTHSILPPEERKAVAEKYFPYFGYEESRPKTKPVEIGDYCWLGERSAILKGSQLGNNVVVGYSTVVSGKQISDNSRVVCEAGIRVI